jgi:hypothetical protein
LPPPIWFSALSGEQQIADKRMVECGIMTEKKQVYQINSESRISRRNLLSWVVLTGAGLSVAGAIYEIGRTWLELHSQPFPYDSLLSATATAATREGLATTLQPEAPFTAEMIQQVRNNTGIVFLELNDGTMLRRSAWLAQGGALGEGFHIVTAAHDAPGEDTIAKVVNRVHFGRPNKDASFIAVDASTCQLAAGKSSTIPQDVDLISVPEGAFSSLKDADGIPFIDRHTPNIGDAVLHASYPIILENTQNLLLSILGGNVTHVIRIDDLPDRYTWGIKGIAATFSSGGLVAAVVDGTLVAVGVISQRAASSEALIVSSLALNQLHNSIAS